MCANTSTFVPSALRYCVRHMPPSLSAAKRHAANVHTQHAKGPSMKPSGMKLNFVRAVQHRHKASYTVSRVGHGYTGQPVAKGTASNRK
eukprot:scaffold49812_cov20-Tisochrysis_lutea.AAC.2